LSVGYIEIDKKFNETNKHFIQIITLGTIIKFTNTNINKSKFALVNPPAGFHRQQLECSQPVAQHLFHQTPAFLLTIIRTLTRQHHAVYFII